MSITTKAIHNLAVKKEKASKQGEKSTFEDEREYIVTETYRMNTNARPETIRSLIATDQIPHSEYMNYDLQIKEYNERYFYHQFKVTSGHHTFIEREVFTLSQLIQISKEQNCEGTEEEIIEDSHMLLCHNGYHIVDKLDEDLYWNNDETAVADLSFIEEITEEEYRVLERRL